MCGGPRRPPPAPPPSTSSSPFAKPPPQGALPASGDARVAQIDPTSPVELGMFGGMILLGGIAGLSSRRKGKGEP